jgi:predicted MFS family arabinose efflux permease
MSRSLHVSPGRVGFLVTSYAAASFLAAIPLAAALAAAVAAGRITTCIV